MSKINEQTGIEEYVQDCLKGMFDMYFDEYEHEYAEEYVPYGDTFASLGDEITEESQEQCVEDFKQDFDFDEFMELLANSDFKYKILDMVERGEFQWRAL